jgi:hypothetical protein
MATIISIKSYRELVIMRTKDEQQIVSPSARARDIVTILIARYGLLQAVEIGQHVQAQLNAAMEQQKRRHPGEWPTTRPGPPRVVAPLGDYPIQT